MVYVSKYNWNDIQSFYDAGNSWQEVINEFGCTRNSIQRKLRTGILKGRTRTETYYIRKKQGKIKKRECLLETKNKMSKSMKKAHAEGRAHNIGTSRWNNEPSWPEKFFMKVIKNDFQDKEYLYEQPFHIYSLDFLWLHKKKVIEIDGEQHERFEEQKRRDREKDRLLLEEGYQLLRIRWKDMFHNTQFWIQKAKDFIDN